MRICKDFHVEEKYIYIVLYKHIPIAEFTCIYFVPCLFENQCNNGKDKTYMKLERTFFI